MTYLEIGLKDRFEMISKLKLNQIINKLQSNLKTHSYKTNNYKIYSKILQKEIDRYYNNYKIKKNLKLGNICEINFPPYIMGAISSKDLLNIDEIIIFCFYYLNKKKYKIVYDLGSNIGIHSLILSKLNSI